MGSRILPAPGHRMQVTATERLQSSKGPTGTGDVLWVCRTGVPNSPVRISKVVPPGGFLVDRKVETTSEWGILSEYRLTGG